ncbi:MAG TPA: DNA-directed RNA polymerase subunit beta' [Candidatus Saccharimonadales bacterium]|nr:DNA-directed RNA polymerase subunit beta' [Candidatus Saccharimonadales bacterium]
MNEIRDFKALRIALATKEDVMSWSHGEITKPETINYRTFKPEKDGLFDEKIFGPTKDWECYCGKYKRIRYRGVICDKCGVEVTQSKVRRERMGHLKLAAPVAHVWFFKGVPSKLSQILDITPRSLDAVIYFAEYLVISVDEEKRTAALEKLDKELKERQEEIRTDFAEQIKVSEKAFKEETKKMNMKNKEQQELIVSEIELKSKAKTAAIRDEEVAELTRLENIFKTLSEKIKGLNKLSLLSEEDFYRFMEYGIEDFSKIGMGAEAIEQVLKDLDLAELAQKLRAEVQTTTGQKLIKATKRLRVVESLRTAGIDPASMIMEVVPVIPPDLRPMVQLSGGRFATSDLNDLYRRVINRNNRLRRLTDLGAPEIILRNEKRMLQEAVDALIDSSQRPSSRVALAKPLRSLSDMLKGKQGRFRQNLLGKRVDYSGRSVIIVAPDIKLNECRVPKEMALELFKPYVLRELIFKGYAPNVKSAKHVFERRGVEVWDILEEITKNHPVLLNRAPTLHRLGIQAFFPILTEGSAIGIHPSVCAGYGADFDGDQMAIHVPLSQQAQEEAIALMMSTNNLLRPSDGEPIMTPKHDVFLGCYYLTQMEEEAEATKSFGETDAILALEAEKVGLHEPINLYYQGEKIKTTVGRLMFNQILPPDMRYLNKVIKGGQLKDLLARCLAKYGNVRTVELIDDLKRLGFQYSSKSGVSISIFDAVIAEEKKQLIANADIKVEEIDKNFRRGLITDLERLRLSEEIWASLTNEIDEITWKNLPEGNALKILLDSGARGSRDQIKQLAGMRGLVVDPLGRIIELPTKTNYREGLEVYEYFTSTRGARKGLVDKALKTADAGHLTRRLVDVTHDVLVRVEDCGTKEGITIVNDETAKKFESKIVGRYSVNDTKDEKGKTAIKKDTLLTSDLLSEVDLEKIKEIVVRSTLTCETKYGICQKCYGYDLAAKKLVEIGVPVGVIAAQSIGEPGTQLTMRTFHLGGIVGLDITQGLPRVDEIFEARTPKTGAVITEIPGKVEIVDEDDSRKVVVTAEDKTGKVSKEYVIPVAAELHVKDGELVAAGDALTSGHLDLKLLLETKGIKAVQQYIISELQKVYESQGAPINEKHFETIVRKMSEKVKIETSGDTSLLPGELVDKVRFADENARILAAGGEPATASVVILGITRAALYTESVLSAASFQETISVLTEAATSGKVDYLRGLKENVIIGRLIPTGERARMNVAGPVVDEVVEVNEIEEKNAEEIKKEAKAVVAKEKVEESASQEAPEEEPKEAVEEIAEPTEAELEKTENPS